MRPADEGLRNHLETLRQQAAEATLISALTTVPHKRELFAKHAEHLNALASEVERALAANRSGPISLCFIDANAIGSL